MFFSWIKEYEERLQANSFSLTSAQGWALSIQSVFRLPLRLLKVSLRLRWQNMEMEVNVKRSSVGEGEKENNQPIAMQCWLWSLCHKASMRVKWNGLSGSEGKVRTKGAWTKVWLYSDFNALPLAYGGISSAGLSPGEELTLHSSFLCLYCQSVLYVTFNHSFSDKCKS